MGNNTEKIPMPTLNRLPSYLNYLKEAYKTGIMAISSSKVAEDLRLNQIQVRKDLALVSSTPGKPRIGFDIVNLINDIEIFLGYKNVDSAVIVGIGCLGSALLSYEGFKEYGLNIVAGFDSNDNIVNTTIHNKKIFHISQFKHIVDILNIKMGIITVPKQSAQEICNTMVEAGIVAIWNFAPIHLIVPDNVVVKDENMATSLSILSRKLSQLISSN